MRDRAISNPGFSALRVIPAEPSVGKPLPESRVEQPPIIRRAVVVAFALVSLLVITVVADHRGGTKGMGN